MSVRVAAAADRGVPELLQLEVDSIAAGGDGVGRAEGMVVFVPRTAPGDRVQVRVRRTRRFARGELVEIMRPSAVRVPPPCPHYTADRCGGCQLQHLEYDAQLAAKATIVQGTLRRIGKREWTLPQVDGSERQWRYRAKLTLAMRRGAGGWTIGLHAYDDPTGVFQLDDCPITDDRVVASWREVMSASRYFPEADELRASVRLAATGAAVVMQGGVGWPARDAFFDAVPSAAALWWERDGAPRRLVAERATAPAGASFGQINQGVAARLQEHVLDRIRALAPRTVVDAYAGVGDTAVGIARLGARVTAIEVDRDAAARCASRLPAGSRVRTGRVEDLLPEAMPADLVLVNPPRQGLHERVTAFLDRGSRRPRSIIYVSCDPATLARDLARLGSYRLVSVLCFDMFPQTAHVETVCELAAEPDDEAEREAAAAAGAAA